MIWALYALIHSISRAFFVETNRVYRANPWHITFWQALCGLIVLLPAVPFMHWPENGHFYFAAIVVAGIMAFGYMIQLGLAAQKTGRVSAIHMALEALCAAVLWVLIHPESFATYQEQPVITLAIVLALTLMIVGMLKIRPSDISWATFAVVAPVGMTYAIAGVTTKIVIPATQVVPTILTYVFVSFAVMTAALGAGLLLKRKADAAMRALPTLKAGFLTGLFSAAAYTTFVCSVVLSPNPGYTSALAMLLPVWLFLFHRAFGVEDRANPLAALALVAGAVMLVGLSGFFSP